MLQQIIAIIFRVHAMLQQIIAIFFRVHAMLQQIIAIICRVHAMLAEIIAMMPRVDAFIPHFKPPIRGQEAVSLPGLIFFFLSPSLFLLLRSPSLPGSYPAVCF